MASTFKRFVHRSCAAIVVDELDAGRLKRVPNPVSQAASKFALPDSGEIGSVVGFPIFCAPSAAFEAGHPRRRHSPQ